jgi:sensor histidine kinase YesM
MSEYTLLDYVQTILSSLDSDEVNSYDDTVESLQVANIVKTVYNDVQARVDLPEHYTLFELNASGDPDQPTLMFRPDDVMSVEWVQYDKILDGDTNPVYTDIPFKPLDEFLKYIDNLDVDEAEVGSFEYTIGSDTVLFKYRNDQAPSCYTTFDDNVFVFDAYDSDVDTTLQKDKTRCYGRKEQSWTMSNTFVPFLDRDLSTLLLNEAKVLAFAELKQMGHDVARQWANRGWTKSQISKRGIDQKRNELDRAPNFGR